MKDKWICLHSLWILSEKRYKDCPAEYPIDLDQFRVAKISIPAEQAFEFLRETESGRLDLLAHELDLPNLSTFAIAKNPPGWSVGSHQVPWPSLSLVATGSPVDSFMDEDLLNAVNTQLQLLDRPYLDLRDATREHLFQEVVRGGSTSFWFVAPVLVAFSEFKHKDESAYLRVKAHRVVERDELRLGIILRKGNQTIGRATISPSSLTEKGEYFNTWVFKVSAAGADQLDALLILEETEMVQRTTFAWR